MPRHGSEDTFVNESEFYEEFIEKRGLNKINQYATPKIPPLTKKVRRKFTSVRHVWTMGDKYFKIADKFYGDPRLWWVVAWYNQKPNEGMLKVGDVIFIPQPLNKVLTFFDYGTM
jgi:nucleoid-associated protein YgaU|tara:strand:- start:4515 stop:4859 length:345 start_codon:yes stop_codon:yes gene_type:complete